MYDSASEFVFFSFQIVDCVCESASLCFNPWGRNVRFCSPSVAPCAPLTRPLFFTGVKRGVCSQINHFPEDADFDHDGAEYVLRKSTLQHCKKNLMKDQADGGRTLSHGPIRENPLLVKWSSILHTQGLVCWTSSSTLDHLQAWYGWRRRSWCNCAIVQW